MFARLAKAFWLWCCAWLWRLLRLRWAGRRLIAGLDAGHEETRAVAGMMLAKAGKDALPLLAEAVERRRHLEIVLPILADLGAEQYRPVMEECAAQPNPLLAKTGRDSLKILEHHQQKKAAAAS